MCAASPTSASLSPMNVRAVNKPSGNARRGPTTVNSPSRKPKRFSSSAWNSTSGSATIRFGFARVLRPHDRAALTGQRQDRERSRGEEMLFRAPVMFALVRDRRYDRRLVVIPAITGDTCPLADHGIARRQRRRAAARTSIRHRLARPRRNCRSLQSCQPRQRAVRRRALFAFATSASTRCRFSIMCANGSPSSTSPPKARNVGRTASSSFESVTTMSRIGCAFAATASQTSIASNRRRAAAAIAEARGSFDWACASAGSMTVTVNGSPSPCRRAIASARPAKPAPPMTTSARDACGGAGFIHAHSL